MVWSFSPPIHFRIPDGWGGLLGTYPLGRHRRVETSPFYGVPLGHALGKQNGETADERVTGPGRVDCRNFERREDPAVLFSDQNGTFRSEGDHGSV